jgi:ribosomal protein S18 acetylase RimI-like enzyme
MLDAAKFSSIAWLPNGRRVEIRALKQSDGPAFVQAIERMSAGSLYRRFFSVKRYFTSQEVAYFLNVDFVSQVALVAVVQEEDWSGIVGAGRYIIMQPGRAELAFAVIDQYQGQGIGKVLMRDLAAIARESGLDELFAEVLPDNVAMLKVFEKSGYDVEMRRTPSAVQITIDLGSYPSNSKASESYLQE